MILQFFLGAERLGTLFANRNQVFMQIVHRSAVFAQNTELVAVIRAFFALEYGRRLLYADWGVKTRLVFLEWGFRPKAQVAAQFAREWRLPRVMLGLHVHLELLGCGKV
jgi:hypothetical protein